MIYQEQYCSENIQCFNTCIMSCYNNKEREHNKCLKLILGLVKLISTYSSLRIYVMGREFVTLHAN